MLFLSNLNIDLYRTWRERLIEQHRNNVSLGELNTLSIMMHYETGFVAAVDDQVIYNGVFF